MPASDVTVTVTFKQTAYNIIVKKENCDVEVPATAKLGANVTITATPHDADKYTFESITINPSDVDLAGEGSSWSFTMPAKDVTVDVVYKAVDGAKFNVTVKNSEHGSVDVHPEKDIKVGRTVTVTPEPDDGYAVDTLTVTDNNGKKVKVTEDEENGTYSFKMPEGNVTVEATFKKADLKVNVAETEHGKVTVKPQKTTADETVTVTATLDKGYDVDRVYVLDSKGKTVKVTENNDGTYSFKMPATNATVFVTFKETNCPSKPYKDINTNLWYHEGVGYAIANGLMKGVAKDQFDPYGDLSRAMLVTILYRLEGEPKVSGANPFSDVEAGSWYDKAVNWADAKGIVNGYGNGKFGPTDNITREQMAAMMMRYSKYKKIDTSKRDNLRSFSDAGSVSSWARENMQWAVAEGLIEGSGKKLSPQDPTTSAQAATILMRFGEDIMK